MASSGLARVISSRSTGSDKAVEARAEESKDGQVNPQPLVRLDPHMFYAAMADDNEEAWAGLWHDMRAEQKRNQPGKNAEGVKRVCRGMWDKKPERGSIYPRGRSGEG